MGVFAGRGPGGLLATFHYRSHARADPRAWPAVPSACATGTNVMKSPHLIVILAALACFVSSAAAFPVGYSVSTVTGVDGGSLYRIDLANGSATLVGSLGLPTGADVEAINFDPTTGILYGYDDTGLGLYTIDTATGAATSVGGSQILANAGLSF